MKFLRFLLVHSAQCFVIKQYTATPITLHRATVFASPWDEDDSSLQPVWNTETAAIDRPALVDVLSRTSMASLARLAAAFSPNKVHVRDIEDIRVLYVDETHFDLQAVVCEEGGCVTLAVPITFPHPCQIDDDSSSSSTMEVCVMENIDELDMQASQVIRQLEWEEEHHEEVQALERERQTLRSSKDLHYPDWWSIDKDMAGECRSIRRLLNEDGFEDEVRALAAQALESSTSDDIYQVHQAAVAAVCPTGMIIRASANTVELFPADDQLGSRNLLEVPIPFGEHVTNVEGLRSAVLGAVAAATATYDIL